MESIKLYHGDCLDIMKDIPDDSVDLTVTSPPYDNLRTYNGNTKDWGERVWKAAIKDLYRVTSPGGVVVWIVGDATIKGSETGTSFRQALWAMECGFNLHDTMIYYRWSGPLNHKRYEQEFEYMFVFSKGKPQTFNPILVDCAWHGRDADRLGQHYVIHSEQNRKFRSGKERNNIKPQRIKGNVWKMKNSSQSGERHGHPAPFPKKLAYDHIISWSNEGDTVLDIFMGSGTTGVVCKQLNRNFIGIEIDKEYFSVAKKRIEEAQIPLFKL